MEQSIRTELLAHVINTINDQALESFEDLHFHAFNEDYYIIGYWKAEQWLESHGVSAFEAIGAVIEWERGTLGEVSINADDMNAERIVNLYVYTLGEELLSEFDLDQDKSDLINDLSESLEELAA